MKNACAWIGAALGLLVSACGDDGGQQPSASASSQICAEVSGLEAVYWDFINGVPRGDLPSTAFMIPFEIDPAQSPYSNSTSLLLGFIVPQGWTASDGADVSGFAIPGTVAAADLIRAGDQAVWRYMFNAQLTGGFTSAGILDSEIAAATTFLGNPSPTTTVCEINVQQNGILGPVSVAARLLRVGEFTIFSRAQVTIVSGVGAYLNGFTSVAPTAESERLINDIFVPMITQLFGGGSDPAACADDNDNDGDGSVDFPADPQCTSPSDDDESS